MKNHYLKIFNIKIYKFIYLIINIFYIIQYLQLIYVYKYYNGIILNFIYTEIINKIKIIFKLIVLEYK